MEKMKLDFARTSTLLRDRIVQEHDDGSVIQNKGKTLDQIDEIAKVR